MRSKYELDLHEKRSFSTFRVNSDGFTLIEVLIALAILAISLIAVIRSTNVAVNNTHYLKQKTIAALVASNVLAQAQAGSISIPIVGSSHEGSAKMLDQTWKWQIIAQPTKLEGVVALRINVKEPERENNIASLTNYVYQNARGVVVLWR